MLSRPPHTGLAALLGAGVRGALDANSKALARTDASCHLRITTAVRTRARTVADIVSSTSTGVHLAARATRADDRGEEQKKWKRKGHES